MRRRDGTHHDHSRATETDVTVRRLFASAGDATVTIGWDYPGSTLLEVRILRSSRGPARGPDDVGSTATDVRTRVSARAHADGACGGPILVYQDVTGSFRDTGLVGGRAYFYSVFARHPGGEWVRWEDLELSPRAASGRPDAPAPAGRLETNGSRRHGRESGAAHPRAAGLGALVLTAALLVAAFVLALGGALPALAEDAGQGDEGKGGEKAAGNESASAAWDIALADTAVAGLLGGREPATAAADVDLWSAESDPPGASVYLLWPDGPAAEIDAELPVVRRRDPDVAPVAPYDIVQHRVRASDVTGLRVLVDLVGGSVLEVYPYDEHAEYVVHEDTTPPFSWLPWFTAHAWVLLPVFAAAAFYLGLRAWLRSRAWRRRLPSMSRHDRQFMGRIMVALLMAAAIVVMAITMWRAVTSPILDPDRLVGGDLSTWPLVLFPPVLYAAALGVELTGAPHRVAWGLVAVLAGVSCVYSLVAMREATVTDLTLLYFILLGCLALIAIPRAFSPGKLGWSRQAGRAAQPF